MQPPHDDGPLAATSAASTTPLPPERRLTGGGPYRFVQILGSGGMGEVWLAEQTRPVKRLVALKIIRPGMESQHVIARFEAERQALALMVHPSIATVFDGGTTTDGRPFFVMEYVKGEPITTYCDRHRLALRDRLALFQQVCEAVQHAHQKGVIHRDLKPSNVLVTVTDERVIPKIIDFGVAKAIAQPLTDRTLHTELGALIGTPAYMSPEQAEMGALDIDTRTDVYALGVMLYEMLTGALPLDRDDLRQAGIEAVRRAIREREPVKPSTRITSLEAKGGVVARNRHVEPERLARLLRGDLDWITMKALEKDRTRRYGSASDLAADLARYLRSEPVTAGPPSARYRLGKFARRHPAGLTAGIAIVLLSVAFGVVMALQARRIAAERDAAARERTRAEQVSAFLVSLFQASDPNAAKGSEPTARELLDRGVTRLDSELKNQPLTRATLLHTIGGVYREIGRYAEARPLLETSVTLRRLNGAQRADLADAINELGRVYRRLGDVNEAERKYLEALAIRREVFGQEHMKIADSLNFVAGIAFARGQMAEAEKYLREAAEMARRVGRPVDAAELMASLAAVLSRQDKSAEAIVVMRESAETLRQSLGIENTSTLSAMSNLGRQLFFAGEYSEARTIQDEVLRARRKLLGPDHLEIALSLYTLGESLERDGRLDEAEQMLRESVAMFARVGRAPDVTHAYALDTLGRILSKTGRHGESIQMFRDAVGLFEKASNAAPGERGWGLEALGGELHAQKKFDEAEKVLRQALAVRLETRAPPSELAWSQASLGRLLCERGAAAEGLPLTEAALQTRRARLRAGHWTIALSEVSAGQCLIAARRFDEAQSMLTGAHSSLVASRGESPHVSEAALMLATLYDAWDKPDQAAAWRAKAQ